MSGNSNGDPKMKIASVKTIEREEFDDIPLSDEDPDFSDESISVEYEKNSEELYTSDNSNKENNPKQKLTKKRPKKTDQFGEYDSDEDPSSKLAKVSNRDENFGKYDYKMTDDESGDEGKAPYAVAKNKMVLGANESNVETEDNDDELAESVNNTLVNNSILETLLKNKNPDEKLKLGRVNRGKRRPPPIEFVEIPPSASQNEINNTNETGTKASEDEKIILDDLGPDPNSVDPKNWTHAPNAEILTPEEVDDHTRTFVADVHNPTTGNRNPKVIRPTVKKNPPKIIDADEILVESSEDLNSNPKKKADGETDRYKRRGSAFSESSTAPPRKKEKRKKLREWEIIRMNPNTPGSEKVPIQMAFALLNNPYFLKGEDHHPLILTLQLYLNMLVSHVTFSQYTWADRDINTEDPFPIRRNRTITSMILLKIHKFAAERKKHLLRVSIIDKFINDFKLVPYFSASHVLPVAEVNQTLDIAQRYSRNYSLNVKGLEGDVISVTLST